MKKVICIGDSIRMGYEPTVVRELEDWQVVRLGDRQCGNTRVTLEHMDEWLSDDLDVVHINAGLHDMAQDPTPDPDVPPASESRVTLEEYRANLDRIFKRIASTTQAQIVFGLTTPVDLRRQHESGKGIHRTNENVAAYNAVASQIAIQHGAAIDDLHKVVVDNGPAQMLTEDGVHFTDEGSAVLGRAVASAIRQVAP
jgi:lysophospholipase L1-like esterase